MNKVCNKCNETKELNEKNFYKAKTSKDGYMGLCKVCKTIYDKAYVSNNRKKVAEWENNYKSKNKEKIKQQNELYKLKNKEKISRYNSLYISIQKNKERRNNLRRIKYQSPTPEKRRELYIKDKANQRIRVQRYKSNKKQLLSDFTKNEWNLCQLHFDKKCAYCGSEELLHQDHFIALSKGGEYTKSNIIPACNKCNSSKHNKEFAIWYINKPYYNKEREIKVIEYLTAFKTQTPRRETWKII